MKPTQATLDHTMAYAGKYADRPIVTYALLTDMTRRIVEACDPEMVVLFGSYGCGEPNGHSDVDIFAVMNSTHDGETNHRRVMNVRAAARVPFLPLDVVVRTPEEVEARLSIGDFFIRDILDRGKVLYRRDSA